MIRTLNKCFDLGCIETSCKGLASGKHPSKSRMLHQPVVGYQKALKRCKDLDLGVCLPTIIPKTFLAQAVLEQSLEEATPMINQGNKNHPSSLLRCRDTSFVQPGHFQFGDYWHVHLLLLKAVSCILKRFLLKLRDKKSSLRQHRKLLN